MPKICIRQQSADDKLHAALRHAGPSFPLEEREDAAVSVSALEEVERALGGQVGVSETTRGRTDAATRVVRAVVPVFSRRFSEPLE
jgi:hypothetical protein